MRFTHRKLHNYARKTSLNLRTSGGLLQEGQHTRHRGVACRRSLPEKVERTVACWNAEVEEMSDEALRDPRLEARERG